MRLRFTLLFLLLVAVPLALMAWIGVMLVRQQQAQALETWLSVIEEKLGSADALLSQEMTRLESDLDSLLQDTTLNDDALHELPREQPLVRHAFLLNARGEMIFPKSTDVTQVDMMAFLRRTESIWESGVRLGSAAAQAKKESAAAAPRSKGVTPLLEQGQETLATNNQEQATYQKKADGRPNVKVAGKTGAGTLTLGTTDNTIAGSGWHVWFYGSGPQMIFWQERGDKRVVGVEIEMAALLSTLVNRLSSNDSPSANGLMQLTSADGKTVLHQWGKAGEDDVLAPVAQRNCAAPLGMWKITYCPAQDEAPRTQRGPVFLALGGAGLAMLAVALLFLRESTRDMREARRRVSFVNQVSHELKTPLTNIRLYAEMAQQRVEELNDDTASRHLSVVEAETSRLSRLIHNVLTFARQHRDQLTVHARTSSLDDVTQRVVNLWRPVLEAKGFALECTLAAPLSFFFDPDAVEQIIGNLLSNVEKYAEGGRFVRITTEADEKKARLIIEDRGPGIPTRMREAVFAPFVRVRSDISEGVSGTGIGLSIARSLAELMLGSLALEDVKGGGSRFVLTLPRKQP